MNPTHKNQKTTEGWTRDEWPEKYWLPVLRKYRKWQIQNEKGWQGGLGYCKPAGEEWILSEKNRKGERKMPTMRRKEGGPVYCEPDGE